MNVADCIARASLPDTHYVLGAKLLPYSIGKWRLLYRCGASFVCGGSHSLDDLLVGVIICAETYDGFMANFARANLAEEIERWQRKLSGGLRGRVSRAIRRALRRYVSPDDVLGFNFADECARFERYIDEHGGGEFVVNDWSRPVTIPKTKGSATMHAPELEVLLSLLTCELSVAESTALDMSLPLARWLWAVNAERRGLVAIRDMDERTEDQKRADAFVATL